MYTFTNAVLKRYGKNQTWQAVNASLLTLKQLVNGYVDGHLVLSNPTISANPLYVDLRELKSAVVPFLDIDVDFWLASLNDTLLPFLSAAPTYISQSARYADAWQAQYTIQACRPNLPRVITGGALDDVGITKPNIDVTALHNRVLTSVNGLFHLNYGVDEFLVIKDGGRSLRATQQPENKIGLLSFAHICDIVQLPISLNMLQPLGPTIPYKQAVLINTGLNLLNQSVMISIGGYLHCADSIIDVLSATEGIIKINMEYMSLARRLFEMSRYMDLDSLQITRSPLKPGALVISEFNSNQFIERLLCMSQSFLVIVDTPTLTRKTIAVKNPELPGFYEYGQEPIYPLLTPTGRINDYWLSKQGSVYVMAVTNNFYQRFSYESTDWEQHRVVNERGTPDELLYANGQLLELTSTIRA